MKKMKVVLAVAVAAVLVMAMSITAFAAPAGVTISNGNAKTGDTVTVTVSTSDKGMSADVAVEGLEVTGVTGGMSTESNVVLYQGNTTATYTCKVTAEAGEAYSFALTNVEVSLNEGGLQSEADAAVSGTVAAAVNPDPEPSTPVNPDPEPSTPVNPDPQPSTPVNPDPQPSTNPETPSEGGSTGDTAKDSALDDVPKTGDAATDMWVFAVIALAAAGTIGIAAYRKAFSK